MSTLGRVESTVYGFMANWYETSALSLFLNVSYADLALCEENIESSRKALMAMSLMLCGKEANTLAKALQKLAMFKPSFATLKDFGLVCTFPAWLEYLGLASIILDCEETVLKEVKDEFKTCTKYWEEWDK